MAFLFKLITVAILATVARSRSLDQLAEAQSDVAYLATEDTAPAAGGQPPLFYANPSPESPYALPLNLQLPKVEAPRVPFYSPDPNSNLNINPGLPSYLPDPSPSSLPQFLQTPDQPNYYQVPVPDQELKAPVESWNPENDPKFYYEIPVILTKQQLPTNQYPKKYNKEIHSKSKPFSSKPKEEIAIIPIDEKQYLAKQKSISKVFDNLAKKENRKTLEHQKVYKKLQQQQQQKQKLAKLKQAQKAPQTKPVARETFSKPEFSQKSSQKLLAPPQKDFLEESKLELEGSASGFLEEAPHHAAVSDSKGDFSHGLSSKITASLGIPHAPEHGERLEFHMTGHDGPHSYKWGYDTGKGHNRHFRYEERDKEGIVKGHFGFYDKHGDLKMFHYDSHPHHGFHSEEGHPADHHEHF